MDSEQRAASSIVHVYSILELYPYSDGRDPLDDDALALALDGVEPNLFVRS